MNTYNAAQRRGEDFVGKAKIFQSMSGTDEKNKFFKEKILQNVSLDM